MASFNAKVLASAPAARHPVTDTVLAFWASCEGACAAAVAVTNATTETPTPRHMNRFMASSCSQGACDVSGPRNRLLILTRFLHDSYRERRAGGTAMPPRANASVSPKVINSLVRGN